MATVNNFCGFYLIYIFDLNYFYLGASMQLNRRWTEHKRDLKNGKHKNRTLQKAWDDALKKAPGSADRLTATITEYSKLKSSPEIKFVFIPLLQIPVNLSWTKTELNEMRSELEEYEEEITNLMSETLGLPSVNIWLKPGTKARLGAEVCIDKVFYPSKAEAARALNLLNKNVVNQRLEVARWATWCSVTSDNKLIKKLRKMNSSGQRLGYETWQYGEVLIVNNERVAKYWREPKRCLDNTQDD